MSHTVKVNIPCSYRGNLERLCHEYSTYLVVRCEEEAPVRNGDVHYSNGLFYDSTASYICDEGFELIGASSRVCRDTGAWSETAPQCQSEYIY